MNTLSCDEIDFQLNPVDFRKISTPSTTKAVIFNFDERYPDKCPDGATTSLRSVLSAVCDNLFIYENKNATSTKFLEEIEDGKKWHYFVFYVFAHGGNKCFALWNDKTEKSTLVTSANIWKRIGDAQNRFIGMFDNCYSGSQLSVQENEDGTLFAQTVNREIDICEDLIRRFQLNDRLFSSSGSQKPMFQLWASTPAGHIGYYDPMSGTLFSRAIKSALTKVTKLNKNARNGEYWEKIVQSGSSGTNRADDDKYKIVPQKMEYGESFTDNIALT